MVPDGGFGGGWDGQVEVGSIEGYGEAGKGLFDEQVSMLWNTAVPSEFMDMNTIQSLQDLGAGEILSTQGPDFALDLYTIDTNSQATNSLTTPPHNFSSTPTPPQALTTTLTQTRPSPLSHPPTTQLSTSQSPQSQTSPKKSSSSSSSIIFPTPSSSAPSSTSAPLTKIQKRHQNTLAARRYRQKRVDQVTTLEAMLKEVEAERDALKNRVSRLEGEVEVLRGLVKK